MSKSRFSLGAGLTAFVAALVLLVAGEAFAGGAQPAHAAHHNRMHQAMGMMFSGQIESVDSADRTLTIREKGKDVTVGWTDDTKLSWKSGRGPMQPASSNDLSQGERVFGRAAKGTEGNLVAQSLVIRKPMEGSQGQTGDMKK
jgi:hypothetical protein